MPLEPTTVPPAGRPVPPAYVPAATPPAAPPPAGLRARLRARRAGLRAGVRVEPGAALGRGVVLDVARGARIELGAGCALGDGCRLHASAGTIAIGPRAVLGERCAIAAHAGVAIGADAVLGDEAVVIDFEHRHDDPERPVRLQGVAAEAVTIGAGARIGARAAIQRGVTVADRAQVPPLTAVSRPAGRGTPGGSRSRRAR